MAAHVVEHCVYDSKTMSTVVDGDDADSFLRDKLCEQGLKGECAPSTAAAAPAHFIFQHHGLGMERDGNETGL